jgi:hypothetical protein
MSESEPDHEAECERVAADLRRGVADARARIGADALRMLRGPEPRSFEPRRRKEDGRDPSR